MQKNAAVYLCLCFDSQHAHGRRQRKRRGEKCAAAAAAAVAHVHILYSYILRCEHSCIYDDVWCDARHGVADLVFVVIPSGIKCTLKADGRCAASGLERGMDCAAVREMYNWSGGGGGLVLSVHAYWQAVPGRLVSTHVYDVLWTRCIVRLEQC